MTNIVTIRDVKVILTAPEGNICDVVKSFLGNLLFFFKNERSIP